MNRFDYADMNEKKNGCEIGGKGGGKREIECETRRKDGIKKKKTELLYEIHSNASLRICISNTFYHRSLMCM